MNLTLDKKGRVSKSGIYFWCPNYMEPIFVDTQPSGKS